VLCLSPATARCTNLVQKNQFPEINRHILIFSQINFTVWSHILCTIRDALTKLQLQLCFLLYLFPFLHPVKLIHQLLSPFFIQ
jgi:hypothetical protein